MEDLPYWEKDGLAGREKAKQKGASEEAWCGAAGRLFSCLFLVPLFGSTHGHGIDAGKDGTKIELLLAHFNAAILADENNSDLRIGKIPFMEGVGERFRQGLPGVGLHSGIGQHKPKQVPLVDPGCMRLQERKPFVG